MPVILAIEPDRRQRDALAAVVRQRVGAELILADTTEHALEAIGNRVPDLVLVPALLSPQDDAALAAALRVIAAAAHVRTLTIPMLAAHAEAMPSSGLLSRWRRGRSASPAQNGCDPAVFAEQIGTYLKESAAERALMVDDVEDDVQVAEPAHAQEFGWDDVQTGASAPLQVDAQAYEPDMQTVARPDVANLQPVIEAQPDVTHVPPVAYAQQDVAYVQPAPYTQPDTFTEPEVVYTPTYQAYVQPVAYAQADTFTQPEVDYTSTDAAYVQPVAYTQPDAYTQPAVADTRADVQANAQPDVQPQVRAEDQDQAAGILQPDAYATVDEGGGGLPILRSDQEEDIDLSAELADLDTEESGVTVSGDRTFSAVVREEIADVELFDGEPIGIYTMPSVVDGPDTDVVVAEAPKTLFDIEAAVEPAFAAESELETDAAVDPGFFEESFVEPGFDAEPVTQGVFAAEPAIADRFEAEAVGDAAAVEDNNLEDAAPEPADAEPWISAVLSPRWAWPAMEGVPTEPPAVFVPVDVAVAVTEARPAPASHKRPEWGELVASLRKDIERRRVVPPQEKPKPNPPVHAARRSRQAKPVQDEWGFFDPEQCGFAALLAKLDEITEAAEDTPVHRS